MANSKFCTWIVQGAHVLPITQTQREIDAWRVDNRPQPDECGEVDRRRFTLEFSAQMITTDRPDVLQKYLLEHGRRNIFHMLSRQATTFDIVALPMQGPEETSALSFACIFFRASV